MKTLMAKIAYDAYCAAVDGKSAITGAPLPPYEELPELVRAAWMRSASAVQHEERYGVAAGQWTADPPNQSGYYFVRSPPGHHDCNVVRLTYVDGELVVRFPGGVEAIALVDYINVEWWNVPIPLPPQWPATQRRNSS